MKYGCRGFSLLEVMIALIIVSIGIGIFLNVTLSDDRKTTAQATGNDYSLVVNAILHQFTLDVQNCENGAAGGTCNHLGSNGATTNYTVQSYVDDLSTAQLAALKAEGIDPDNRKITITAVSGA